MVNILIGLGSPSDLKLLERLEPFVMTKPHDMEIYVGIASAHRTPAKVEEFARTCMGGLSWDVIIGGAGLTNALASDYVRMADLRTIVIGLPISDKATGGLSSLLSSSELPPGYPVGCVRVDHIEDALMLGYLAASRKYSDAIIRYDNDSGDFAEKISSELKRFGINNKLVYWLEDNNEPNKLIISAMGTKVPDAGLVISGYPCAISALSKKHVSEYLVDMNSDIYCNILNIGILNPTNVAIYAAKIIGRNNPEIIQNIEAELAKGREKYAGHKYLHVVNDLKDLKKLIGVE